MKNFLKHLPIQKNPEVCWNWAGPLDAYGYGQAWIDGRNTKAHRAAYRFFVGRIPTGRFVLHNCDNRKCVNPDHLRLGGPKENSEDMVRRARSAKGETHSQVKLSEAEVKTIRKLYGIQNNKLIKLARQFKVGKVQIHRIVKRKQWKHC